jgi:hypothetical protein
MPCLLFWKYEERRMLLVVEGAQGLEVLSCFFQVDMFGDDVHYIYFAFYIFGQAQFISISSADHNVYYLGWIQSEELNHIFPILAEVPVH